MQISFEEKTVIVTGAAHGFGRAIARGFCGLGATVWASDILANSLDETAAEAPETPRGSLTVRTVDVSDRDAVRAFVAEAEAERGHVDIAVNNAGGIRGQVHQPVEQVAPEQWQEIFDVNLTGAFNVSGAVVPGMKRVRDGRIVNISSRAGLATSLTGIQAYAAAKAGQIGLTRQLAHELGPYGIRVNSVAPGFVRTSPSTERQWQSYDPARQQALIDGIALRRLGRADDIVHAVLFLASDYAAWITGQTLSVDGGV